MEQIRSFIAIELPDELKPELVELQARLKTADPGGVKWVDPQGIHLTLKFLGNIAADRTGDIIRAMNEAARGIPPFQLTIGGLGVFPNPRRAQVAWVGLSGQVDKLARFQAQLEASLARLGFAPETRPFSPHLTLARLRPQASPAERQSLGQLIISTRFASSYPIVVTAINLMRSQLTRQGAIYSQIGSVELKSGK